MTGTVGPAPGPAGDKASHFLLWLLVLCGVGFGIYAVGVGTPYYADDFQFVFDDPGSKFLYYFFHENPNNPLYRPVQSSYLALVQSLVGLNTAPIQLLQILLHIGLAALVFRVMVTLGCSRIQAMIGSLWMVASQANVHTVISNDTQSQGAGTLFGCLSVWFLYRYCFEGRNAEPNRILYALSLSALAVSLWSKESSVSYVGLLFCVVLLERLTAGGLQERLRITTLRLVPFAILAGLYLVGRAAVVSAQPRFGSEAYAFAIGPNVLVNLGLFAFGAMVPVSSVVVAAAAHGADYVRLIPIALATVLLVGLVAFGLWKSKPTHRRIGLILLGFGVVSLFPTVLMNHVSELYLYNAMPFVSILGGIGLGRLFELSASSRPQRAALTAVCVLVLVSHGVAVTAKAGMMKRQGRRAGQLLEQIVPLAEQAPTEGRLVLLNPEFAEPGYSSFRQPGFKVLNRGTHRINELVGRDDFSVDIVEVSDASPKRLAKPCLVLALDDGAVTIHSAEVDFCPSVARGESTDLGRPQITAQRRP